MESSPQRKSCLPIVEHGCCCDLKTCCGVQGIVSLIFAAIIVCKAIIALSQGATCQASGEPGLECETRVIGIIFLVITLIADLLFLWAIDTKQPRMMLPYILTQSFVIVGIIAIVFVVVVLSLAVDVSIEPIGPIGPTIVILLVLFLGPFLALLIYMVICANSLRIKMEDCQNGQIFNTVDALRSTTPA